MRDARLVVHAAMRSMVAKLGCYDAVAEVINARWGGNVAKGAISKKMSGINDWSVSDVMAMQDALGDYPITRLLSAQMKTMAEVQHESLPILAGSAAKEMGEALQAIMADVQSDNPESRAAAISECREAIEVLQNTLAALEAGAK
jgi:hypothetical protein